LASSIRALESQRSTWDDLAIERNTALWNIEGLAGLPSLGRYLFVRANPLLPQCASDALHEQLIALTGYCGSCGNDETPVCKFADAFE